MFRPTRYQDCVGDNGLRHWFGVLWRFPGPRLLAGALAAVAVARIVVGRWQATDFAVAAGFVVAQPFTEWVLHVGVLHFRPRRVAGRTIDLYAARKHREHHLDPQDIPLTLIQLRILVVGLVVLPAVYFLALRDVGLWLTALIVSLLLVLVYEWTHFLIHSPYVPRSRYYRYVWRAHRLHHFKNERYWFGITVHLADHVLRTFPDHRTVEISPTARTLLA
jgi:hypothetical protein